MATYEQVTYNSPDGAQIGKASTEKLGFFGATPADQPAAIADATDAATAITKCNEVIAALEELGLIAS